MTLPRTIALASAVVVALAVGPSGAATAADPANPWLTPMPTIIYVGPTRHLYHHKNTDGFRFDRKPSMFLQARKIDPADLITAAGRSLRVETIDNMWIIIRDIHN